MCEEKTNDPIFREFQNYIKSKINIIESFVKPLGNWVMSHQNYYYFFKDHQYYIDFQKYHLKGII
jgi:hypothetical protein